MKANLKITVLVSIQIILIVVSFLSLSILENNRQNLSNTLNLIDYTQSNASNLIFEVERHLLEIPYAEPNAKIMDIREALSTIRYGGDADGNTIFPIDSKYDKVCDVAHANMEKYLTHMEQIIEIKSLNISFNDPEFLILDTEKFDAIGSLEVLHDSLDKEVQNLSETIIQLEVGLAIINVGIHIFMVILIFEILKNEQSKNIRLEKFAVIGELAARLAHDLRNPLNVIRGAVRLLDSSVTSNDEKTLTRYDMINRAIDRMTHHLDDVLDFVRTKKLNLQDISFSEIINTSISRIKIHPGVTVIVPKNDLIINVDSIQFETVLVNIISNSLDAIGEKGTIEIRLKDKSSQIIIECEDSGPGIPNELLKTLFEPLVTTKEVGTGLGLSSCKNIIEQHGGTISVSNNPTIFSIVLPKN